MIKFVGDNGRIEVDALDYQDVSAANCDDRNWLTCRILACLGDFRFTANCAIQTYDIQNLYDLFKCKSRSFSWSFPEDDIVIELCVDDGTLKSVRLVFRHKIAAEEMSCSCTVSTQMPCRDILDDIEELMVECPVLR